MSTDAKKETWPGYRPAPWQPEEGVSNSPVTAAAIQAAVEAETRSETASVLIATDPDLTAGGQAKKYAKEWAAPTVKQLRDHLGRLDADQQADIQATEAIRKKVNGALPAELTPSQRELLSIVRAASPAERNEHIGAANRGELPELAAALAIAPKILSNVTDETRAMFRKQLTQGAISEEDNKLLATLRAKKFERERATRYVNSVIAAHIAASDRDTLAEAGLVGRSVKDMTSAEKNALLNKPGGLAEYERRLAGVA